MKRRIAFIPFILLLLVVFSCGHNLRPTQKYTLTRMTFNDILRQYEEQAMQQPEAVKVELRKYVHPVIKEARDALDIYKVAVGSKDESAKYSVYVKALDKLTDLFLKYGIVIKEEQP